MRVLVTGGAGYIGSHTLIELHASGHDICVVDNFDNSSPEALNRVTDLIGAPVEFHQVDIRDRAALDRVMAAFRPEVVIHFAGLKAVGESAKLPLRYYDVNISGTLSLLESMQTVGCNRIVFSSSATVYGAPHYLPFDENHPCAPTNVYGHTKHMAEQILTDWTAANPAASVVLLRYFNPVGAHPSGRIGEDPRDVPNNLMPFVAQVAVGRREKLSVFGDDYDTPDGTGVRDFIHVTDLARAHVSAIGYAAGHSGTEVFNIGTGRGYSVLEMVTAFARASGRDIAYEIAARRPGDIARSEADPSKANALLGWQAEQGLEEMCASTWAWQSGNPQGFESS
ncbi:UDP-glucose 4-epimerase [Thalassovita gelatinovora]|uniref:UDP-glucose 4-epimerase GalE n=1 Tax=Thalassovita gelatinovora TaxID=53501 RepID=UPI0008CAC67E|nr:UDP-glucose 4-epimerase GalE [Thalassovita gelatinovora]QIZ82668.1 UDP-glucose 4-epimerase GalE [Thalassovita gelatinovora]SER11233.1 UDP-glucose 4-epimerase [Thalassovita gelatinovora]